MHFFHHTPKESLFSYCHPRLFGPSIVRPFYQDTAFTAIKPPSPSNLFSVVISQKKFIEIPVLNRVTEIQVYIFKIRKNCGIHDSILDEVLLFRFVQSNILELSIPLRPWYMLFHC